MGASAAPTGLSAATPRQRRGKPLLMPCGVSAAIPGPEDLGFSHTKTQSSPRKIPSVSPWFRIPSTSGVFRLNSRSQSSPLRSSVPSWLKFLPSDSESKNLEPRAAGAATKERRNTKGNHGSVEPRSSRRRAVLKGFSFPVFLFSVSPWFRILPVSRATRLNSRNYASPLRSSVPSGLKFLPSDSESKNFEPKAAGAATKERRNTKGNHGSVEPRSSRRRAVLKGFSSPVFLFSVSPWFRILPVSRATRLNSRNYASPLRSSVPSWLKFLPSDSESKNLEPRAAGAATKERTDGRQSPLAGLRPPAWRCAPDCGCRRSAPRVSSSLHAPARNSSSPREQS